MLLRLYCALALVSGASFAWQSPAISDWPMYNRDYASTRFSPLTQIRPENVANLRQVCSYVLPGGGIRE
jgi:glucose dehydrogenase